ncbi:chromate transporter [bacterium]|nr:chromate transporter [bacterium]
MRVPLALILWEYFLIGITGFGGGLQGRFYHLAVSKHGWLNDEEFAEVNATASLAPGGNASNVGIEIARRLRGVPGMWAAYICLILPGSLLMLAAGATYEVYRDEPVLRGALQGLQCAATALILYSVTKLNLSRWNGLDYLLALGACLAIYLLKAPLWLVLGSGALVGLARRRA